MFPLFIRVNSILLSDCYNVVPFSLCNQFLLFRSRLIQPVYFERPKLNDAIQTINNHKEFNVQHHRLLHAVRLGYRDRSPCLDLLWEQWTREFVYRFLVKLGGTYLPRSSGCQSKTVITPVWDPTLPFKRLNRWWIRTRQPTFQFIRWGVHDSYCILFLAINIVLVHTNLYKSTLGSWLYCGGEKTTIGVKGFAPVFS